MAVAYFLAHDRVWVPVASTKRSDVWPVVVRTVTQLRQDPHAVEVATRNADVALTRRNVVVSYVVNYERYQKLQAGLERVVATREKQPSGRRRPALSELLDNTPNVTRVSDWDEMHEQLPAYEQDDGPLTKKQIAAIKRMVPQRRMGGTRSLL